MAEDMSDCPVEEGGGGGGRRSRKRVQLLRSLSDAMPHAVQVAIQQVTLPLPMTQLAQVGRLGPLAGLVSVPCWLGQRPLLAWSASLAGLVSIPCWLGQRPLLAWSASLAGLISIPCWLAGPLSA